MDEITKESLERILIENSGNLLIYGERGLGKTTFIQKIFPYMSKTIYLNLASIGGQGVSHFTEYLADELNDETYITEYVDSSNIKSIIKKYNVTIILEEWELLKEGLISYFIDLVLRRTRFILIGFHQLRDVIENKSDLFSIEKLFYPIKMPRISEKEFLGIIEKSELTIDDEAKTLLYQETAGHGIALSAWLIYLRREYSEQKILPIDIKNSVADVRKSISWWQPNQELALCQKH